MSHPSSVDCLLGLELKEALALLVPKATDSNMHMATLMLLFTWLHAQYTLLIKHNMRCIIASFV